MDTTEQLHFHFSLSCTGGGNGSPLQCSCLENPRDGRAWWAAVYRVTQSRTRLKRLSSSSSKTSPTQQKYNSSHPWIFKCSNRHAKKSKTGEIMFNGVFYLTRYIWDTTISICKQWKTSLSYYTFFICTKSSKSWCVFYNHWASQVRLVPFQVFSSHLELESTNLDDWNSQNMCSGVIGPSVAQCDCPWVSDGILETHFQHAHWFSQVEIRSFRVSDKMQLCPNFQEPRLRVQNTSAQCFNTILFSSPKNLVSSNHQGFSTLHYHFSRGNSKKYKQMSYFCSPSETRNQN